MDEGDIKNVLTQESLITYTFQRLINKNLAFGSVTIIPGFLDTTQLLSPPLKGFNVSHASQGKESWFPATFKHHEKENWFPGGNVERKGKEKAPSVKQSVQALGNEASGLITGGSRHCVIVI